MQGVSEFRVPETVLYGTNALEKLGERAIQYGKKALIISDSIMNELGYVERCKKMLASQKIEVVTFIDVNTEPTDEHVVKALSVCKKNECDLVIGLGGGSCIDVAKTVAVIATNGGNIGEYAGNQYPITKVPLSLIVIPTTAGTGSEVTSATVITNTSTDVKMMIKHPSFIPQVAIVDPLLTMSTPSHVTAATGIDALCHAIEAYISRLSQPLTDIFALSAIEKIMKYLRIAYEDGQNVEAREQMMLASMEAGIAFTNASVTLVHGMSRPIGAMFHVPHGLSNAMLLPAVLEFTKDYTVKRLSDIGRKIRPDLKALSNEEFANITVNEIKHLCTDLRIPNMNEYGIHKDEFELVIAKMAKDALASGSPSNNPRIPSYEEVIELYRICYDYNFVDREEIV
ncbi:alcohol dehydrogenase [Bacillus sp. AFS018417]|uniref:iron-containing alcohol dehydrogenase n=1 Tax=unclassified Bacillus (in: firmicutes) TaxID=185979 RepID=UPI000BF55A1C|nr:MULTISPECIES: iron-containing alcohol dehydrogenase [unclassified Bacillus (in: firmicutes)]MCP1123589.1 iron-containing alcohol dehydrogenase [Bacillus sp. 3103sda1]PEZ01064.1 alcohol dehydrogenase [Bacillus sp. AFS018417]